jgi:hypothetical protein
MKIQESKIQRSRGGVGSAATNSLRGLQAELRKSVHPVNSDEAEKWET